MAKIIGYSIGAVFVCLILSPLPIGLWKAYTLTELMLNSTSESAVITRCFQRSVKSGANVSRSWAPLAETDKGFKVRGDFGWKKKRWCEWSIGDTVKVLVHDADPQKSKINSFFQLWFFPVLMWCLSVALVSGAYTKYWGRS